MRGDGARTGNPLHKLKKEQELAQSLQEQLDEFMDLDGQESSLDDLIDQLDQDDPSQQGQAQNYQNQKALIEKAKQALADQMQQGQDKLNEQRQQQQGQITQAMKKAMGDAAEAAEEGAEETAQAWGSTPAHFSACRTRSASSLPVS